MPHFRYVAKNNDGKTVRGLVEGKDDKDAIDILRNKQLITLSLSHERGKPQRSLTSFLPAFKRVRGDDIVVFARQLATVVEAGIPLVNALDIIGEQMEKPDLRERINKVRDDVEAGAALSEAISKDKEFFSSFFVNMVKAGESSGNLDEILDRLASYMEKTNNLQKKVSAALIYPAVVTFMAIAITLILIIKVIPVFKDIYSGFGAQLPGPTEALLAISDFFQNNLLALTAGLIVLLILLGRFGKTARGRKLYDTIKLSAPIFGPLIQKVAVTKFTRTFSTLVRSGVPILNSLDIVGKTAGNVIIENAVDKVKTSVRDGENIATPLAKVGVFPPLVVRMISVGEKTGELEKMLIKISDFYDAQVDAAIGGLTSLIEPLIIAFLGIVIGTIVICMFLPILQISSMIRV